MWQMEKVKRVRKGSKTYTYWMACWRNGDRTQRPRERREDGCRGSPPEGQGDEGGGAGDANKERIGGAGYAEPLTVSIRNSLSVIISVTSWGFRRRIGTNSCFLL
jgi:hypothetical protein